MIGFLPLVEVDRVHHLVDVEVAGEAAALAAVAVGAAPVHHLSSDDDLGLQGAVEIVHEVEVGAAVAHLPLVAVEDLTETEITELEDSENADLLLWDLVAWARLMTSVVGTATIMAHPVGALLRHLTLTTTDSVLEVALLLDVVVLLLAVGESVDADEMKDLLVSLFWFEMLHQILQPKIYKWHLVGLVKSVMSTFLGTTTLNNRKVLLSLSMLLLIWRGRPGMRWTVSALRVVN